MPMRVIAMKRCRAMFEPPEKGERATLNPNLSTRLNLLFPIRPLDGLAPMNPRRTDERKLCHGRRDFN